MTCAADGGYLMEINSATEHAFLNGSVNNATGLLPASNLVGRPYIGVIRKTPGVNWFVYANATTTNLSVTYWNTDEPNGLSSGEDCVVVISTTVGNDGRAEWNDVACSTVAPFICEYNRPEVNPCTAAACNGTPSPAGACGAHDGAHGAGVASLGQRCDYDYLGRRCDLFPIDCTISAWSAWSTCEAATNPQCSPPLTASPSPPLTRSLPVTRRLRHIQPLTYSDHSSAQRRHGVSVADRDGRVCADALSSELHRGCLVGMEHLQRHLQQRHQDAHSHCTSSLTPPSC